MRRALILVGLLSSATACGSTGGAERDGDTHVVAGDSILDMVVMVERFQAQHAPISSFPEDAAGSRTELLERLARAVRDSSSADLRKLALTGAEFAWLYFPSSMYSRPPYAQPPEITWLLTEQNGLKGETRLLRHYGGRRLRIVRHQCEQEPRIEGSNRIWNACRLTLVQADGSVLEHVRLFGTIIERDGRYKFGSFANRL